MAVFHKQTRIISFRLSEEEYKTLEQISMSNGAHSVSDYARRLARAGLITRPRAENPQPNLNMEVEALNQRVDEVYRHLVRLARLVDMDLAPVLSGVKDGQ